MHRPRSHPPHHHSHHRHSSYRNDQYSVAGGLSEQYHNMQSYVVNVHQDEYPRSMVPEPMLTSVSLGIRVEPFYPDTREELEREPTPKYHYKQEVIYDNDIFEVVSKPRFVQLEDGERETFAYTIRHKHDHSKIDVLQDDLVKVPRRRFETGAIVRYVKDGRKYEILGAAFLPQEYVWDYKIARYSATEGDIKRNVSESRLERVNSEDSHLTPPQSRDSPPRPGPSPKGSLSSLMDSLFKH